MCVQKCTTFSSTRLKYWLQYLILATSLTEGEKKPLPDVLLYHLIITKNWSRSKRCSTFISAGAPTKRFPDCTIPSYSLGTFWWGSRLGLTHLFVQFATSFRKKKKKLLAWLEHTHRTSGCEPQSFAVFRSMIKRAAVEATTQYGHKGVNKQILELIGTGMLLCLSSISKVPRVPILPLQKQQQNPMMSPV